MSVALSELACTFGYHLRARTGLFFEAGANRDQGGTSVRSSYKEQTMANPQPCKGKASAPARSENLSGSRC